MKVYTINHVSILQNFDNEEPKIHKDMDEIDAPVSSHTKPVEESPITPDALGIPKTPPKVCFGVDEKLGYETCDVSNYKAFT